MVEDPFERNWLEIRILIHLNNFHHPITLHEMKETLVPDMQESIVWTTFHLMNGGLLEIRDMGGGKFVQITPQGRNVLAVILSGRASCT